jgi:hypothetical protein
MAPKDSKKPEKGAGVVSDFDSDSDSELGSEDENDPLLGAAGDDSNRAVQKAAAIQRAKGGVQEGYGQLRDEPPGGPSAAPVGQPKHEDGAPGFDFEEPDSDEEDLDLSSSLSEEDALGDLARADHEISITTTVNLNNPHTQNIQNHSAFRYELPAPLNAGDPYQDLSLRGGPVMKEKIDEVTDAQAYKKDQQDAQVLCKQYIHLRGALDMLKRACQHLDDVNPSEDLKRFIQAVEGFEKDSQFGAMADLEKLQQALNGKSLSDGEALLGALLGDSGALRDVQTVLPNFDDLLTPIDDQFRGRPPLLTQAYRIFQDALLDYQTREASVKGAIEKYALAAYDTAFKGGGVASETALEAHAAQQAQIYVRGILRNHPGFTRLHEKCYEATKQNPTQALDSNKLQLNKVLIKDFEPKSSEVKQLVQKDVPEALDAKQREAKKVHEALEASQLRLKNLLIAVGYQAKDEAASFIKRQERIANAADLFISTDARKHVLDRIHPGAESNGLQDRLAEAAIPDEDAIDHLNLDVLKWLSANMNEDMEPYRDDIMVIVRELMSEQTCLQTREIMLQGEMLKQHADELKKALFLENAERQALTQSLLQDVTISNGSHAASDPKQKAPSVLGNAQQTTFQIVAIGSDDGSPPLSSLDALEAAYDKSLRLVIAIPAPGEASLANLEIQFSRVKAMLKVIKLAYGDVQDFPEALDHQIKELLDKINRLGGVRAILEHAKDLAHLQTLTREIRDAQADINSDIDNLRNQLFALGSPFVTAATHGFENELRHFNQLQHDFVMVCHLDEGKPTPQCLELFQNVLTNQPGSAAFLVAQATNVQTYPYQYQPYDVAGQRANPPASYTLPIELGGAQNHGDIAEFEKMLPADKYLKERLDYNYAYLDRNGGRDEDRVASYNTALADYTEANDATQLAGVLAEIEAVHEKILHFSGAIAGPDAPALSEFHQNMQKLLDAKREEIDVLITRTKRQSCGDDVDELRDKLIALQKGLKQFSDDCLRAFDHEFNRVDLCKRFPRLPASSDALRQSFRALLTELLEENALVMDAAIAAQGVFLDCPNAVSVLARDQNKLQGIKKAWPRVESIDDEALLSGIKRKLTVEHNARDEVQDVLRSRDEEKVEESRELSLRKVIKAKRKAHAVLGDVGGFLKHFLNDELAQALMGKLEAQLHTVEQLCRRDHFPVAGIDVEKDDDFRKLVMDKLNDCEDRAEFIGQEVQSAEQWIIDNKVAIIKAINQSSAYAGLGRYLYEELFQQDGAELKALLAQLSTCCEDLNTKQMALHEKRDAAFPTIAQAYASQLPQPGWLRFKYTSGLDDAAANACRPGKEKIEPSELVVPRDEEGVLANVRAMEQRLAAHRSKISKFLANCGITGQDAMVETLLAALSDSARQMTDDKLSRTQFYELKAKCDALDPDHFSLDKMTDVMDFVDTNAESIIHSKQFDKKVRQDDIKHILTGLLDEHQTLARGLITAQRNVVDKAESRLREKVLEAHPEVLTTLTQNTVPVSGSKFFNAPTAYEFLNLSTPDGGLIRAISRGEALTFVTPSEPANLGDVPLLNQIANQYARVQNAAKLLKGQLRCLFPGANFHDELGKKINQFLNNTSVLGDLASLQKRLRNNPPLTIEDAEKIQEKLQQAVNQFLTGLKGYFTNGDKDPRACRLLKELFQTSGVDADQALKFDSEEMANSPLYAVKALFLKELLAFGEMQKTFTEHCTISAGRNCSDPLKEVLLNAAQVLPGPAALARFGDDRFEPGISYALDPNDPMFGERQVIPVGDKLGGDPQGFLDLGSSYADLYEHRELVGRMLFDGLGYLDGEMSAYIVSEGVEATRELPCMRSMSNMLEHHRGKITEFMRSIRLATIAPADPDPAVALEQALEALDAAYDLVATKRAFDDKLNLAEQTQKLSLLDEATKQTDFFSKDHHQVGAAPNATLTLDLNDIRAKFEAAKQAFLKNNIFNQAGVHYSQADRQLIFDSLSETFNLLLQEHQQALAVFVKFQQAFVQDVDLANKVLLKDKAEAVNRLKVLEPSLTFQDTVIYRPGKEDFQYDIRPDKSLVRKDQTSNRAQDIGDQLPVAGNSEFTALTDIRHDVVAHFELLKNILQNACAPLSGELETSFDAAFNPMTILCERGQIGDATNAFRHQTPRPDIDTPEGSKAFEDMIKAALAKTDQAKAIADIRVFIKKVRAQDRTQLLKEGGVYLQMAGGNPKLAQKIHDEIFGPLSLFEKTLQGLDAQVDALATANDAIQQAAVDSPSGGAMSHLEHAFLAQVPSLKRLQAFNNANSPPPSYDDFSPDQARWRKAIKEVEQDPLIAGNVFERVDQAKNRLSNHRQKIIKLFEAMGVALQEAELSQVTDALFGLSVPERESAGVDLKEIDSRIKKAYVGLTGEPINTNGLSDLRDRLLSKLKQAQGDIDSKFPGQGDARFEDAVAILDSLLKEHRQLIDASFQSQQKLLNDPRYTPTVKRHLVLQNTLYQRVANKMAIERVGAKQANGDPVPPIAFKETDFQVPNKASAASTYLVAELGHAHTQPILPIPQPSEVLYDQGLVLAWSPGQLSTTTPLGDLQNVGVCLSHVKASALMLTRLIDEVAPSGLSHKIKELVHKVVGIGSHSRGPSINQFADLDSLLQCFAGCDVADEFKMRERLQAIKDNYEHNESSFTKSIDALFEVINAFVLKDAAVIKAHLSTMPQGCRYADAAALYEVLCDPDNPDSALTRCLSDLRGQLGLLHTQQREFIKDDTKHEQLLDAAYHNMPGWYRVASALGDEKVVHPGGELATFGVIGERTLRQPTHYQPELGRAKRNRLHLLHTINEVTTLSSAPVAAVPQSDSTQYVALRSLLKSMQIITTELREQQKISKQHSADNDHEGVIARAEIQSNIARLEMARNMIDGQARALGVDLSSVLPLLSDPAKTIDVDDLAEKYDALNAHLQTIVSPPPGPVAASPAPASTAASAPASDILPLIGTRDTDFDDKPSINAALTSTDPLPNEVGLLKRMAISQAACAASEAKLRAFFMNTGFSRERDPGALKPRVQEKLDALLSGVDLIASPEARSRAGLNIAGLLTDAKLSDDPLVLTERLITLFSREQRRLPGFGDLCVTLQGLCEEHRTNLNTLQRAQQNVLTVPTSLDQAAQTQRQTDLKLFLARDNALLKEVAKHVSQDIVEKEQDFFDCNPEQDQRFVFRDQFAEGVLTASMIPEGVDRPDEAAPGLADLQRQLSFVKAHIETMRRFLEIAAPSLAGVFCDSMLKALNDGPESINQFADINNLCRDLGNSVTSDEDKLFAEIHDLMRRGPTVAAGRLKNLITALDRFFKDHEDKIKGHLQAHEGVGKGSANTDCMYALLFKADSPFQHYRTLCEKDLTKLQKMQENFAARVLPLPGSSAPSNSPEERDVVYTAMANKPGFYRFARAAVERAQSVPISIEGYEATGARLYGKQSLPGRYNPIKEFRPEVKGARNFVAHQKQVDLADEHSAVISDRSLPDVAELFQRVENCEKGFEAVEKQFGDFIKFLFPNSAAAQPHIDAIKDFLLNAEEKRGLMHGFVHGGRGDLAALSAWLGADEQKPDAVKYNDMIAEFLSPENKVKLIARFEALDPGHAEERYEDCKQILKGLAASHKVLLQGYQEIQQNALRMPNGATPDEASKRRGEIYDQLVKRDPALVQLIEHLNVPVEGYQLLAKQDGSLVGYQKNTWYEVADVASLLDGTPTFAQQPLSIPLAPPPPITHDQLEGAAREVQGAMGLLRNFMNHFVEGLENAPLQAVEKHIKAFQDHVDQTATLQKRLDSMRGVSSADREEIAAKLAALLVDMPAKFKRVYGDLADLKVALQAPEVQALVRGKLGEVPLGRAVPELMQARLDRIFGINGSQGVLDKIFGEIESRAENLIKAQMYHVYPSDQHADIQACDIKAPASVLPGIDLGKAEAKAAQTALVAKVQAERPGYQRLVASTSSFSPPPVWEDSAKPYKPDLVLCRGELTTLATETTAPGGTKISDDDNPFKAMNEYAAEYEKQKTKMLHFVEMIQARSGVDLRSDVMKIFDRCDKAFKKLLSKADRVNAGLDMTELFTQLQAEFGDIKTKLKDVNVNFQQLLQRKEADIAKGLKQITYIDPANNQPQTDAAMEDLHAIATDLNTELGYVVNGWENLGFIPDPAGQTNTASLRQRQLDFTGETIADPDEKTAQQNRAIAGLVDYKALSTKQPSGMASLLHALTKGVNLADGNPRAYRGRLSGYHQDKAWSAIPASAVAGQIDPVRQSHVNAQYRELNRAYRKMLEVLGVCQLNLPEDEKGAFQTELEGLKTKLTNLCVLPSTVRQIDHHQMAERIKGFGDALTEIGTHLANLNTQIEDSMPNSLKKLPIIPEGQATAFPDASAGRVQCELLEPKFALPKAQVQALLKGVSTEFVAAANGMVDGQERLLQKRCPGITLTDKDDIEARLKAKAGEDRAEIVSNRQAFFTAKVETLSQEVADKKVALKGAPVLQLRSARKDLKADQKALVEAQRGKVVASASSYAAQITKGPVAQQKAQQEIVAQARKKFGAKMAKP